MSQLWVSYSCILSLKDRFSISLHPPIQPCFGHIKEMTRSTVGEAPAHSTLGFLHPPKPIHHVYHCWRLPGSPSHRRVQGVKRSKGSFPKWSVNNSQKTIPELRGEQLPSPKHRGPLQAGVPRPGASHRAAAPSFWGGECWTNLAAVTNSWYLGSWSMSSEEFFFLKEEPLKWVLN